MRGPMNDHERPQGPGDGLRVSDEERVPWTGTVREAVDAALEADREFYEQMAAEAPNPREKRIREAIAAAAAERRRSFIAGETKPPAT